MPDQRGFSELLQWEDFFAYPGQTLLNSWRNASVQGTPPVRLV